MSSDIYKYTQQQEEIKRLREIVTSAGGVFVGVQETLLDKHQTVIGFTNPETSNYLLVSYTAEASLLYAAIQERLAQDTEAFEKRHVSVKVVDLRRIAKQLLALSQELDALLERKKS